MRKYSRVPLAVRDSFLCDRNRTPGLGHSLRYVAKRVDGTLVLTCGHEVPKDRPLRRGEQSDRRLCVACLKTNRGTFTKAVAVSPREAHSNPVPNRVARKSLHWPDRNGKAICPGSPSGKRRMAQSKATVTCKGCQAVLANMEGRR